MKVSSVVKVATVYWYVETDQERFPKYRKNESGQWERLMGESWKEWYDDGTLEKAFEDYLAGQPVFKIEDFKPHKSLEDGVSYIEHIDDHHVRLTKKASS